MGKQKRQHTKAFKVEAIRLYEGSQKSVREIEEDLGITAGLLNKWLVDEVVFSIVVPRPEPETVEQHMCVLGQRL